MKLTTRLFPSVRRVRVWALVNPRGRVVNIGLTRLEANPIGLTHASGWDERRREGWRVRRLRPEEVAP